MSRSAAVEAVAGMLTVPVDVGPYGAVIVRWESASSVLVTTQAGEGLSDGRSSLKRRLSVQLRSGQSGWVVVAPPDEVRPLWSWRGTSSQVPLHVIGAIERAVDAVAAASPWLPVVADLLGAAEAADTADAAVAQAVRVRDAAHARLAASFGHAMVLLGESAPGSVVEGYDSDTIRRSVAEHLARRRDVLLGAVEAGGDVER